VELRTYIIAGLCSADTQQSPLQMAMSSEIVNQKIVAGSATSPEDNDQIPTLFKPLRIRGVEFQNRIFVSCFSFLSLHETDSYYPSYPRYVNIQQKTVL